MKKHYAFIIFMALSLCADAQVDSTSRDQPIEAFNIEHQPSFPGGESAMMEYINTHLVYPDVALFSGIEGVVITRFLVEKDGSIQNIEILKDIGGDCGKSARKMLESMPKWTPGIANGVPVKVRYSLPLRFKAASKVRQGETSAHKKGNSVFLDANGMWLLVNSELNRLNHTLVNHNREDPFFYNDTVGARLIVWLEKGFDVITSSADRKQFKTLGQVSDYFYQAQFAAFFFKSEDCNGKYAQIPTSRADFDLNADGFGTFKSILVPEGAKLVLFTKKHFKGKKLVLNAQSEAIRIPKMDEIPTDNPAIKNHGAGFNWGLGTQSIKISLPRTL